jgi:hypothetical protein
MREGAKGAKYFYYILFTHLGFNGEKWLHELLGGKDMWFLISCNYINISYGFFGGSIFIFGSSFIVSHSLFLIHSCSWLVHWDELPRKEAIVCWLKQLLVYYNHGLVHVCLRCIGMY